MAIDLLSFAQEWVKPLAQVVGGPAAGAVTGWLLGRKSRKNAEEHASAEQTNAITTRLNSLMDGYENRIKDLTAEVERLRSDVRDASDHHGFGQ